MSRVRRVILLTSLSSGCIVPMGCGPSSGGTITPSIKLASNTSSAAVSLEESAMGYDLVRHIQSGNGMSIFTAAQGGSAVSSIGGGLASLKYFFTSIQICQSMTTQGTSFSNQQGCITLYSGPADSTLNPNGGASGNYTAQANYARTSTTGFIDLISPTSRATLASAYTMKSTDVGSYQWGLVNWAYPIKVTATISTPGVSGSALLYTHDGTTQSDSNGNYINVASTSLSSSPAQEAVITLPNGGSWFRFQNPFVISSSDISNKTAYTIDLTFDPDGIVQGSTVAPTNGPSIIDGSIASPGNAINAPMLDLTPVPRQTSDSTVKETYTCTGTGWTQDLRLELYYLLSDSAKTIYGVSIAGLVNTSTGGMAGGFSKIASIKSNADGSINLLDWQGNAVVASLTRKSTVGQTTTATVASMSPTTATCTLSGKAALQ